MPTISVTIENDIGVERTLQIPAKYEVCGGCQGEGKRVNPTIDGHGLSAEDFDEDPDFREDYFSGIYDVTCDDCHGKRVIPIIDEDEFIDRPRMRLGHLCTGKTKANLLKRINDKFDADAAYASERAYERRMGY